MDTPRPTRKEERSICEFISHMIRYVPTHYRDLYLAEERDRSIRDGTMLHVLINVYMNHRNRSVKKDVIARKIQFDEDSEHDEKITKRRKRKLSD